MSSVHMHPSCRGAGRRIRLSLLAQPVDGLFRKFSCPPFFPAPPLRVHRLPAPRLGTRRLPVHLYHFVVGLRRILEVRPILAPGYQEQSDSPISQVLPLVSHCEPGPLGLRHRGRVRRGLLSPRGIRARSFPELSSRSPPNGDPHKLPVRVVPSAGWMGCLAGCRDRGAISSVEEGVGQATDVRQEGLIRPVTFPRVLDARRLGLSR